MVQDDKALLARLQQHQVEFVLIAAVKQLRAIKEKLGQQKDLF